MLRKSFRTRIIATTTIMVLLLFVVNAFVSTKNARSKFEDSADETYYAITQMIHLLRITTVH